MYRDDFQRKGRGPDVPVVHPWVLAVVNPDLEQPGEGEPGEGTWHCTVIVPTSDPETFEQLDDSQRRFCRWWNATRPDLAAGDRVWLMEYMGFFYIMLAECE
jgi:hypothetical protein